jgi:hypothetical protein
MRYDNLIRGDPDWTFRNKFILQFDDHFAIGLIGELIILPLYGFHAGPDYAIQAFQYLLVIVSSPDSGYDLRRILIVKVD